jgi:hypothetical protein
MLGIDIGVPALPEQETRFEFTKRYADAGRKRLDRLRAPKHLCLQDELTL